MKFTFWYFKSDFFQKKLIKKHQLWLCFFQYLLLYFQSISFSSIKICFTFQIVAFYWLIQSFFIGLLCMQTRHFATLQGFPDLISPQNLVNVNSCMEGWRIRMLWKKWNRIWITNPSPILNCYYIIKKVGLSNLWTTTLNLELPLLKVVCANVR